MTHLLLAVDVFLAATLMAFARQALFTPELFKAIVSFIAFCLLLALVWARLQAPDVALAEAAIGGGLTGGLLLAAMRRLTTSAAEEAAASAAEEGAR